MLVGAINESQNKREPSFGLTLNLIRTSDARSIWTYTTSTSTGEERRLLGIGEPQTVEKLQALLLAEINANWPWASIIEEPTVASFNIVSASLEPKQVHPGDVVHGRVRLDDTLADGPYFPRAYFEVNDKTYTAKFTPASIIEATWTADTANGRYPVRLVLEWPDGLKDSTLLGSYIIDSTPPLIEFELSGTELVNGIPIANDSMVIIPRTLIKKPLSRWRLAFYFGVENLLDEINGTGNLPERFNWPTRNIAKHFANGFYEVVMEAWDTAGNTTKTSRQVFLNRSLLPEELAANIFSRNFDEAYQPIKGD